MSNFYREKEPLCPHCLMPLSSDDMYNARIDMWEECSGEIIVCPYCNEKFSITIETKFLYTTDTEDEYGDPIGD